MVFGEHLVGFVFAVGLLHPFVCVYIGVVVWCGVFFGHWCWVWVWYGGPVYGSKVVVIFSARVAAVSAVSGRVNICGVLRACKAPVAYWVPVPIAYIPSWCVTHA